MWESDKEHFEYTKADFEIDPTNNVDDLVEQGDDISWRYQEQEFSVPREELYELWSEKYKDSPEFFTSEEGIEFLKTMDPADRLCLIGFSSSRLTIAPSDVSSYANAFPEDMYALCSMFQEHRGMPRTSSELHLTTLFANELQKINPNMKDSFGYQFDQLVERSKRRDIAPKRLLDNVDYNSDRFAEYKQAAEGFWKTFDEASQLQMVGTYQLDTSHMFNQAYGELSSEQKISFLKNAIAEVQYALVFEETNNSVFTEDSVKMDNERLKRFAGDMTYNEAHSMLYRTEQPISVYDKSQDYYEYTMNRTAEIGGDIEEYPFHRMLIALFDEMKSLEYVDDSVVDMAVDFWDKNRNPIFGNAIADVLSHANPSRGASQLLERLRSEETEKKPLTAMLYRLEFGRVGISEEGVKYLERMYDLGEYNNPDYHVSRLTSQGEVGVFDEELKLIKYFHLGDLSEEQDNVQANVLDFTYETLFVAQPGETEKQRKERLKYLEEFKSNYYEIAQDTIFEQTGVRLNNLSFREQGWFVVYFNNADDLQKNRLRTFVKEQGEEGLKSFLSLEYGNEMGNVVLDICENGNKDVSKRVFRKYGKMVRATENIREYLKENFESQTLTDSDIQSIVNNLLKRGKEMLHVYSKDIQQPNKQNDATETLDAGLDKWNINVSMFGDIIKHLPREEVSQLKLAEIPVLDKIDNISGSDVLKNPQLFAQMKEIIRKQFPEGDDEDFEHEVKNLKGMRMTISTMDEKVLSFFAKKEMGEGIDYVDWFVSNPDTPIRGLGEATVRHGFEIDINDNRSYYAVAKPHVRSFPISIESLGFSAFAGSTDDAEYKHHYVRMSRLPGDESLLLKQMEEENKQELKVKIEQLCQDVNQTQTLLYNGNLLEVSKITFGENVHISDDITDEDKDGWIMAEVKRQYENGKILSAFMPKNVTRNNRTYYAVFEADPNKNERNAILDSLDSIH